MTLIAAMCNTNRACVRNYCCIRFHLALSIRVMETIMPLNRIIGRARAIRLSTEELARLSGIHRATINRGRRMRAASLEQLGDAVRGEEQRLREYLEAVRREEANGGG